MQIREIAALAIALTLIAFVPYIRAIKRDAIKPHVYSWVIWGIATVVVFLALERQTLTTLLFPTVMAAACALLILLIAYRRWLLGHGPVLPE